MFVNLHNLPPGKSLFTVCVTDQLPSTPVSELCYDEVDVVADTGADAPAVVAAMSDEDRDAYDGQRVIGVIDQWSSYIVMQDPDSDLRVAR